MQHFTLVIILPKKRDGLEELEKKIQKKRWNLFLNKMIINAKKELVDVYVPKINFSVINKELRKQLIKVKINYNAQLFY